MANVERFWKGNISEEIFEVVLIKMTQVALWSEEYQKLYAGSIKALHSLYTQVPWKVLDTRRKLKCIPRGLEFEVDGDWFTSTDTLDILNTLTDFGYRYPDVPKNADIYEPVEYKDLDPNKKLKRLPKGLEFLGSHGGWHTSIKTLGDLNNGIAFDYRYPDAPENADIYESVAEVGTFWKDNYSVMIYEVAVVKGNRVALWNKEGQHFIDSSITLLKENFTQVSNKEV